MGGVDETIRYESSFLEETVVFSSSLNECWNGRYWEIQCKKDGWFDNGVKDTLKWDGCVFCFDWSFLPITSNSITHGHLDLVEMTLQPGR